MDLGKHSLLVFSVQSSTLRLAFGTVLAQTHDASRSSAMPRSCKNHHKHCCRHARTLMLLCPRVALLWEMLHSKPEGLGCLRVKKRANKEVTRMNQLPDRAAGTSRSHLGRNASRICEPFLGLHFSFFICYLSNLSFILSLRNLSA